MFAALTLNAVILNSLFHKAVSETMRP